MVRRTIPPTPFGPGDYAIVYSDPRTRKKYEGFAECLELIKGPQAEGYELWKVRFVKTNEETRRVIHPADKLLECSRWPKTPIKLEGKPLEN